MNSTTLFPASIPASIPAAPEANEPAICLAGWLFVPAPGLVVESRRIQRQSPVRCSESSAPVVSELYHTGGEAIYYSETKRRILTVQQYHALLRQHPKTVKEDWRISQRSMVAYGRGTVRHPEHHPITLHDWHRIVMNTESEVPAI
jgi:hypothetical protein